VSVSGGLIHAHTDWRPLAELSDEELLLLDKINKKLIAPVNASEDGQQNQPKSTVAIEAEVVASERQANGGTCLKLLCSSWLRWHKRTGVQFRFKAQSIRAAPYHFVEIVAASKFGFESCAHIQ
jgi:hypothetical protein